MGVFRRFSNLFRSAGLDREAAAELESHIAMRAEENMARGLSPAEARREAVLRFGNPVVQRERMNAADRQLTLPAIGRDLRYAARQLRHAPGFAATATLTLALGIGTNVVVFGVLNAALLRPLNVANSDRLVEVANHQAGDLNQSYPEFLDYRARNGTFSDMATYRINFAGLSTGGSALRAWNYEVSGNYFDMLGVQPELGRLFHVSDEHGDNSAPYIVLSDSLWRTRFNADPRVIGTTVDLNKQPFTILGVAPRDFHGTELFFWPDFWMPIVNAPQIEGYSFLHARSSHGLYVIGSLRPGVTPVQASQDLNAVARQLARAYPHEEDGLSLRLVKPGLMGDLLGSPARPFLGAVLVLALLVLLAACVNLAGVFAARAADRTRELAIRLSLGSTRKRILRQLLTESLLVSLLGGLAGTAFAALLLQILSAWQPISDIPIRVTMAADWHAYALAFGLSVVSGLLPGLLPARQVWRTDPMQAIKSGLSAPAHFLRLTARDLLLGVQIALCALLVTASLVALRGMQHSLEAPLGFVPQNTVVARMDMKMAGYSDDAAYPVQRRILEEAARMPGVTTVGTADNLPLAPGGNTWTVYREGTTDFKPTTAAFSAHSYIISPGYLAAAETRLVAGRDFTWDDAPEAPRVSIVNQTFARRLFGNQPAVGKRYLAGNKQPVLVVGVVEDGKYESLTEDAEPAQFVSLTQDHEREAAMVVRSQVPAAQVMGTLRQILNGIDSSMPVSLGTWQQSLALVLFPARAATVTLAVMGLLAALLAVTGIFGMAAYIVSRRLRELGIRLAVGARRVQLLRAALGRPFLVLTAGSVLGLMLGVFASRLLAALVYAATPRDPLVLAGAMATMVALGLLATWIPARRAVRINPAELLRED